MIMGFSAALGVIFLTDLGFLLTFRRAAFPFRPILRGLVIALWALGASLLLIPMQNARMAALLILWPLFRWLFVNRRWIGVRRGFGAPGLMSEYAIRILFLLEIVRAAAPAAGGSVLLALRMDFGYIILCAGLYKGLAGYWRGRGMDLGLANPMWSHYPGLFSRMNPRGFFMTTLNRGAVIAEVVCGLLLVLGTLFDSQAAMNAGAWGVVAIFAALLPFVRLGRLAVLMCALPLIYAPQFQATYGGPVNAHGVAALALAYALCLPWIKVMQYVSYFTDHRLPGRAQTLFNAFCNAVPIVLWRVFTDDVVNFYVDIYTKNPAGWAPLNRWDTGDAPLKRRVRFRHVTESIAITSVFTTLRYQPGNEALFKAKLREYSRSLHDLTDRRLFRYDVVALKQGEIGYASEIHASYIVNTDTGDISTEQPQ